ncbi:MAG: carboxy terminal-processing peptidase [Isosphaeraceae bacterium]|nr:carboxy terminal-processing peptidase [Isosphaeraceae bacterium]
MTIRALRRPTGLMALFGLIAISAALVGAQAPALQPTEKDEVTAQIVARLLEQGHLSKPRINDEISKKWCRNFLKSLDPQKYYFIKADVDEFLAQEANLDDQIKEGDLEFPKKVFTRFLKRSDERLAQALEILKQLPDFSVDESMVDDLDRLDWPADEAEAKDRLRKWIKYDLLRLRLGKIDDDKALKQLTVRYKDLNRYFRQFDTTDLLERYLTSLAMAIDPHSSYMGPKTLEDMLNQQLHLSLEGIGASLTIEDGYPVVKEIVPAGAADKDGRLQIEDKIVGIEDEHGEKVDFAEKKLSDVVRMIRGKAGTKVRLIVQPEGSKELKVYELTREKIKLTEQRAKGQVLEAKAEDGKPFKVGVIHLSSFYGDMQGIMRGDPDAASATRDCRRLLEDFKKQGVNIVVMDLRSNGGGLLQEAITLSGLFIDQGPVVQVREAHRIKQLDDDDEGTAWDGPLAVLIDHFSASASEIFAGVIKDYSRGLIIGDSSTYGKGTVQSIIPLNEQFRGGDEIPNLGALKLTIQQFYRPDGASTQIRGVAPDIHIPSLRDHGDFGEGKSESALKFDQIKPLPHDKYNRVPAELVARLQERSDARRKANPKFQEQQELIQKYLDRKARHEISLNEKKFRAEALADDEDGGEERPKLKDKLKKRHSQQSAWESNYYNDEVIAILGDYLTLGSRVLVAAPTRAAQAGGRRLMP